MCGLCMRMIRCESSHQGLVKRGWKGEGRLWLKEGGQLQQVFAPRAHEGESVYLAGDFWPLLWSLKVELSSEAFWELFAFAR